MSHGLGSVQRRILKSLEGGQVTTAEQLRWHLLPENKGLDARGQLPTSWNTLFSKSIGKLVNAERIFLDARPLRSLEECIAYYPTKTLDSAKRKLRELMLPLLIHWLDERSSGFYPKYSTADNEIHHYASLSDELKIELARAWKAIEIELKRSFMRSLDPEATSLFIAMFAKGRNLFLDEKAIAVAKSFSSLADSLIASGMMPQKTAAELTKIRSMFYPSDTEERLRFHSLIHKVVDVSSAGRCKLTAKAARYFHLKEKEVVEGLEGFKSCQYTILAGQYGEPKYPPMLLGLFDHSVFSNFKFIQIT